MRKKLMRVGCCLVAGGDELSIKDGTYAGAAKIIQADVPDETVEAYTVTIFPPAGNVPWAV